MWFSYMYASLYKKLCTLVIIIAKIIHDQFYNRKKPLQIEQKSATKTTLKIKKKKKTTVGFIWVDGATPKKPVGPERTLEHTHTLIRLF